MALVLLLEAIMSEGRVQELQDPSYMEQRRKQQEIATLNACMTSCEHKHCNNDVTSCEYGRIEGFSLISWSCREYCVYKCSSSCLEEHIRNGGEPVKGNGKWVQTRWLGLEEPASAIFSVANGVAILPFLRPLWMLRLKLPKARAWVFFGVISLFTWTFSTWFHAHETYASRVADYMGANALAFSFLFTTVSQHAPPMPPACLSCVTFHATLSCQCVFFSETSLGMVVRRCAALGVRGSLVVHATRTFQLQLEYESHGGSDAASDVGLAQLQCEASLKPKLDAAALHRCNVVLRHGVRGSKRLPP